MNFNTTQYYSGCIGRQQYRFMVLLRIEIQIYNLVALYLVTQNNYIQSSGETVEQRKLLIWIIISSASSVVV